MATKKSKKSALKGPLVSIVVPMHNVADFIDETIHSVLGQTYSNWELILVDIKMPSAAEIWKNVLMKVECAFGMRNVMVIRGYDATIPFWKKMWRRV